MKNTLRLLTALLVLSFAAVVHAGDKTDKKDADKKPACGCTDCKACDSGKCCCGDKKCEEKHAKKSAESEKK